MCVLMVCFNVLELLLDEAALPRGMEVRMQPESRSRACVPQIVLLRSLTTAAAAAAVVLGPSPGDGLFLHVRLVGCGSSSGPHPVSSSIPITIERVHTRIHSCQWT